MEAALFSNEQTVDVKSLRWNKKDKVISFGASTSQLSPINITKFALKEQLKKAPIRNKLKAFAHKAFHYIKRKGDKEKIAKQEIEILQKGNQTIPVVVQILEVEWLSDNMKDLFVYMAQQDDNEIFANNFIKTLLEQ